MSVLCVNGRVKLYRDRRELSRRLAELEQEIELPKNKARRGELKALRYSMQMRLDAVNEYLRGDV